MTLDIDATCLTPLVVYGRIAALDVGGDGNNIIADSAGSIHIGGAQVGSISVLPGGIDSLIIDGDAGVFPDVPVVFESASFGSIEVGGSLFGDLGKSHSDQFPHAAPIEFLSVGGDCRLDANMTRIPRLEVGGTLDVRMVIIDDWQASDVFRIGGSLVKTESEAPGLIFTQSFEGQMVIGATNPTPAADWSAPISAFGTLHINAGTQQPYLAPYYDATGEEWGSGQVGLVPFHLHGTACEPPLAAPLQDDDHPDADRTILNSAFGHIPYGWSFCLDTDPGEEYAAESIVLEFYGPVAAEDPNTPPYTIWALDSTGTPDTTVDYSQWTAYEIVPPPVGGATRRLVIHGTIFPQVLSGHFRITPRVDGSARLLCAGLLPGAAATPVAAFEYDFVLDDDCNTNGVPDRLESTGLCCIAWPCDPDFTQDGNADQDDVAYLANVIAGGPNPTNRDPDFNRDGNADQDDYSVLVDTIASGSCP